MAQDKMLKFLVEGLTRAFDKQEDCDVMFSVDGQTIGAHRLILNIHSQVLYEMAAGWTPDKDPIAIDDMSFDSFKALLRYMYGSKTPITSDMVFIFLSASVHFKMDFLEELGVDHIMESMGTENVCVYMNEALHFKSSILQEKCLELFSGKTSKISNNSFKRLSQPALSAFLDVEETDMVEAALFRRVKLWMEHQCREQGLPIDSTNMRHVIGNALYKIRFPTMTVQDFANCVTTIKGFLTNNEIADIFQKITVFDNLDIECAFPNTFRCKTSPHYVPFSDMENLLEGEIVYIVSEKCCDCSSALKYARDQTDNTDITQSVLSLRLILQCCADLANTSGMSIKASPQNEAVRNEVYEEFLTWRDIVKTKNISDIMTKYSEMRTKLDKLYIWSL